MLGTEHANLTECCHKPSILCYVPPDPHIHCARMHTLTLPNAVTNRPPDTCCFVRWAANRYLQRELAEQRTRTKNSAMKQ
jgi:hypothetical protein